MSNRVILATKVIAVCLGLAIAGVFVWLMASDQPDAEQQRPTMERAE